MIPCSLMFSANLCLSEVRLADDEVESIQHYLLLLKHPPTCNIHNIFNCINVVTSIFAIVWRSRKHEPTVPTCYHRLCHCGQNTVTYFLLSFTTLPPIHARYGQKTAPTNLCVFSGFLHPTAAPCATSSPTSLFTHWPLLPWPGTWWVLLIATGYIWNRRVKTSWL